MSSPSVVHQAKQKDGDDAEKWISVAAKAEAKARRISKRVQELPDSISSLGLSVSHRLECGFGRFGTGRGSESRRCTERDGERLQWYVRRDNVDSSRSGQRRYDRGALCQHRRAEDHQSAESITVDRRPGGGAGYIDVLRRHLNGLHGGMRMGNARDRTIYLFVRENEHHCAVVYNQSIINFVREWCLCTMRKAESSGSSSRPSKVCSFGRVVDERLRLAAVGAERPETSCRGEEV